MPRLHRPGNTTLAIIAITILEIAAILKGINGATFGIVIAALAGLGGYEIRRRHDNKKPDVKEIRWRK